MIYWSTIFSFIILTTWS